MRDFFKYMMLYFSKEKDIIIFIEWRGKIEEAGFIKYQNFVETIFQVREKQIKYYLFKK